MSCTETYKECVTDRKTRVKEAIENAEPWETVAEIAQRAGVDVRTVKRARAALLQNGTCVPNCNKNPPYEGIEPTKAQFLAWVNTYRTWNVTRRKTARQVIFNIEDYEGPV